jgi:hypothetical protein
VSRLPAKGAAVHEIDDPANVVSQEVVESNELLGKECIGCIRILPYAFFDRDSTYRDGRKDLCTNCQDAPRLSTAEHTARLRELNFNSEAVKRQRWDHQDDYRDCKARVGRAMASGEFLGRIKKLVPCLHFTDGRLENDIAIFRTYPCPQPQLDGRDFEYLFYCPSGNLPEYSIYEFDERDILVRERLRGWRTVLLRLIRSGLLTIEQSDREFGAACGAASTVWYRRLYEYRNGRKAD